MLDQLRLHAADERHQFGHAIGVHPVGVHRPAVAGLDFRGDRLALGQRAAGQMEVGERPGQLRAFVNHHAADAAGTDDEDT